MGEYAGLPEHQRGGRCFRSPLIVGIPFSELGLSAMVVAGTEVSADIDGVGDEQQNDNR